MMQWGEVGGVGSLTYYTVYAIIHSMEQQHLKLSSDRPWNERFAENPFSKISSNEWYGTVTDADTVARQQAKREFLEDDSLEAPRLDYPKLHDEHGFDAVERSYQALLSEATTDGEYTKAARRLAELYRHKEIMRSMGRTGLKQALSLDRAGAMAAEIFGEPDRDSYLSLVANVRAQATELQDELPEAAELLSLLGDTQPEVMYAPAELEVATLDVFRADLEVIFPGMQEIVTTHLQDTEQTAAATRRYIEDLLDFSGLSEKGWSLDIIPNSTAAAEANSSTKLITIGEKRAEFASTQRIKTGFHEVFGHAYRSEGATSQASLAFEEAFAVALEQIVSGEPRKGSGEQYYTALGAQYGLDQNGTERTFRGTFEIMWRRAMVIARTKGETLTRDEARDQAYTQVYRTRRGNAIDTRDMSYFEGARVVPQWLNQVVKLPEEERQATLRWVLSGRFDATDARQVSRYPLP